MEATSPFFLELVQTDLAQVEARLGAMPAAQLPELEAALTGLVQAGGKRLRPALALLSARLFNCAPAPAVALAAAIETLHTATLVHDDLIDGALLRRGAPTLNARWSAAATVLTGDYLFAQAAQFAAEADSPALAHRFAETLTAIVTGELNQLLGSRAVVSRAAYTERIYAKTASLFALAAETASLLSGAGAAAEQAMHQYGRAVGLAFQIMDDILDYTSDTAQLGKPAGSDLRQGIITLPALCYLEQAPGDADLAALRAGQPLAAAAVDRVVQAVRRSGAIEAARAEANAYLVGAHAALAVAPDNIYRIALHQLADYAVTRQV